MYKEGEGSGLNNFIYIFLFLQASVDSRKHLQEVNIETVVLCSQSGCLGGAGSAGEDV